MRHLITLAILAALVTGCSSKARPRAADTPATPAPPAVQPTAPAMHPYASSTPLTSAQLFAPGAVSSVDPEFAISFEPDGKTVYFNRTSADRKRLTIFVSRWDGQAWSDAVVAPFSGTYRDIDPFVTHDGKRLYFSSDRPLVKGDAPRPDFDLWFVEREGAAWSEPRHVEGSPNDANDIGFVSLTQDGTMYFDAFQNGVRGLYRARPMGDGTYAAPEALTLPLGTARRGNPLVAADGSYLIFYAELDSGAGDADLYIVHERNGTWTAPRNLGASVNGPQAEFAPGLSPDGRYLLFTSERPGVVPSPTSGRPPGDFYQVELSPLVAAP